MMMEPVISATRARCRYRVRTIASPCIVFDVVGNRLQLAGLVEHPDGSAVAHLVGIHQLPRRDRTKTVVDQPLHSHVPVALPRRELDQTLGNRRSVSQMRAKMLSFAVLCS